MYVSMGRLRQTFADTWALRQSDARAALTGVLLYHGTRRLIGSLDLRCEGREEVLAAKAHGRPIIFVGWHGHDFVNIGVYHPLFGDVAQGALMVPETHGGEVLTHLGRHMNLEIVPLTGGPSTAQSARGVVSMIKLVRSGHDALLAVDGPAGPAKQVKPGAALIAQRAGAVLVPTAAAAARALTLSYRWDDHLIPLPGTRLVVHFGPLIDTIAPPGGTAPTLEDIQERIGVALVAGVRRAAVLCREKDR